MQGCVMGAARGLHPWERGPQSCTLVTIPKKFQDQCDLVHTPTHFCCNTLTI